MVMSIDLILTIAKPQCIIFISEINYQSALAALYMFSTQFIIINMIIFYLLEQIYV